MYIHLGNDIEICSEDIIGVFDIEKTSVNKDVNVYLSNCQKNNKIYYVSNDMPKSFVVCKDMVYITNIAPSTITKRIYFKKL